MTFGTTELFLSHFGLDAIKDLPGLSDLKAAGLLDSNLPPNFTVPEPRDVASLMPDELPLTDDGDEADEPQDELPLEDGEDGDEAGGETSTACTRAARRLIGKTIRISRTQAADHRHAPVFIQSFEQGNLKALSKLTQVRLIQLVDANDVNPDGSLDFTAPFDRPYDWTASGKPELLARTFAWLTTNAGLKDVASYAYGIGPWKRYIVPTLANPEGSGPGEASLQLGEPTDLIERAHAAGLKVHTWTFRNEQRRLPGDYAGNPVNEYLQFFDLGIDGVFSDFPDTAVVARELDRLK